MPSQSKKEAGKISILIPSFNEAKTLPKIISKLLKVKLPYRKEIIVIDDGSTDKTLEIFNKLSKNRYPRPKGRGSLIFAQDSLHPRDESRGFFAQNKMIKLIVNRKNLGKGASIINALKIASGDLVLIQDADLEYNPQDIPKLLKPFKDNKVKVVYGSRILGNNPTSHWTFSLGGKLLTQITNILFKTNITDEATGYKVFRREVIDKINLHSKGFEFCPEVTAKVAKRNIKIFEVPISYNPRPVSEKKIKWTDGILAIYYLFKYRFSD